jgi:hypothetical protein
MKRSMLALVALAAAVAVAGAGFGKGIALVEAPAPKRPPAQAPVSDPAEPPLMVEAQGGAGLTVASSARGTALKLNASGSWQGSAALAFKSGAPPMRFTLTLARMPNCDLESLTLVSGSLSLAVGAVSASGTTRYYDARGREQKAPEGAAYTVTARRWDGELDVEVKRGPGAALGKALTVSWKGRIGYGGKW